MEVNLLYTAHRCVALSCVIHVNEQKSSLALDAL